MQPLASAGTSQSINTNLSTSISLSILDHNGNELSLRTTSDHPYRLIIPRDPNFLLPSMSLQNVTSLNSTSLPHHLLFNLHHIDIRQSNNLTVSIHIEMKPLDASVGYLLIYRFDSSPQLNSSINQIDGWSLFCPSSKLSSFFLLLHSLQSLLDISNDNIYRYFLDNQLSEGHESLIFGLRELNSTQLNSSCSHQSLNQTVPIFDQPFIFTSNYELRIYTSGCYYFDEMNHQWKSDGLVVSIFFFPIAKVTRIVVEGWFDDKCEWNRMSLHTSDKFCRWFHCIACTHQLELCLC